MGSPYTKPTRLPNCIDWTGAVNGDGYGAYSDVRAHRIAYCKHHGISLASIKGWYVLHSCDNRLCVNPEHLRLGTHKENMQDMKDHGRQPRGEFRKNSRLTTKQVIEIKAAYVPRHREFGLRALARKYGVTPNTIGKLLRGESWTHIRN